jgi:hypothetical protein
MTHVGMGISARDTLRAVNTFPAGLVTAPVTTCPAEEQAPVTVTVEWSDGRVAQVPGKVLRLSPEATLVELLGPDGRRRQEWFATPDVRRR